MKQHAREHHMGKFDVLVIESDHRRAESVVSALEFLGYRPQRGEECEAVDEATHAWRAVYVGNVWDDAEAERQFAQLGTASNQAMVLMAADSQWLPRLGNDSAATTSRVGIIPGSASPGTEARWQLRPDGARQCTGSPGGTVRFERAGAG